MRRILTLIVPIILLLCIAAAATAQPATTWTPRIAQVSSATYTDKLQYDGYEVDATSAPVTLTLQSSSKRRTVFVIKVDSSANAVTVATLGSGNINGSSTYTISAQYQGAIFVANGRTGSNENWRVSGIGAGQLPALTGDVTSSAGSATTALAATITHKAGANWNFTDTTDTTKKINFILSGITTGNTRNVTLPDSNTTVPIAGQQLTFAGPTAARTVTLPDSNTTVPAATQQLTFSGPTAGRTITLPDSNTTVPAATQQLTFAGPTAPRTITFPDAAITVARTDASNTFTGDQTFSGNVLTSNAVTGTSRVGIFNFNQAAQSQLTVSGTEYYITRSDLDMPAAYSTAIGAGTTMRWRIALTKDANGTGSFQILLKKGTNGSTGDSTLATITIGTQTAAADNGEADITLTWTSATAAYWSVTFRQSAASGTGFGLVYPATAAQFTGTISGQTTTTASDKYGVSVKFTTGTPTFVANQVQAQAFGVN